MSNFTDDVFAVETRLRDLLEGTDYAGLVAWLKIHPWFLCGYAVAFALLGRLLL